MTKLGRGLSLCVWILWNVAHAEFASAPTKWKKTNETLQIFSGPVRGCNLFVPLDYRSLSLCPVLTYNAATGHSIFERVVNKGAHPLNVTVSDASSSSCFVRQCTRHWSKDHVERMQQLIRGSYRVGLTLESVRASDEFDNLGYPVGFYENDRYYLFNHLTFVVVYNVDKKNAGLHRVVGFEAHPVSVQHDVTAETLRQLESSNINSSFLELTGESVEVNFSYQVVWKETKNVPFYGIMPPREARILLQRQFIWNLLAFLFQQTVLLGLVGSLVYVWIRARVQLDLEVCNESSTEPLLYTEPAWIAIRGQVFLPPTCAFGMSVLVATGVHIITAQLLVIAGHAMGLTRDPSSSEGATFLADLVYCYVVGAVAAGYIGVTVYNTWTGNGTLGCRQDKYTWAWNGLLVALLLPVCCIVVGLICNAILSASKEGALTYQFGPRDVPELYGLLLLAMLPLSLLGSFVAYRQPTAKLPTKVSDTKRSIPPQPCYLRAPLSWMIGSVPPLIATLASEGIDYSISSLYPMIWSTTSIVWCFLQLLNGDYRWWHNYWNCFFVGVYILVLYSIHNTGYDGKTLLLLTVYALVSAVPTALVCGAVSFLSCFCFVRVLYRSSKSVSAT